MDSNILVAGFPLRPDSLPLDTRTRDSLRDYFSQFGEVQNVTIETFNYVMLNNPFRSYMVRFADPSTVVRVLDQQEHAIHGNRLVVRRALDGDDGRNERVHYPIPSDGGGGVRGQQAASDYAHNQTNGGWVYPNPNLPPGSNRGWVYLNQPVYEGEGNYGIDRHNNGFDALGYPIAAPTSCRYYPTQDGRYQHEQMINRRTAQPMPTINSSGVANREATPRGTNIYSIFGFYHTLLLPLVIFISVFFTLTFFKTM